MSAHFLKYAVLAANLTPKLSELDLVDAVAGHYPVCVQRSLLSASVRTVQEALSFLNKLETMENGESNRRSNPGPSQNKTFQGGANNKNNYGRYRADGGGLLNTI
jgi:hypothetical protein